MNSSNHERVKFYSIYDMAAGYELEKAEPILNEHNLENFISDFNDVIELYNIQKYFDNGIFKKSWTDDKRE